MEEEQKSSRHSTWFAVAAFSTIALVALTSAIPNGQDLSDLNEEYKWSVSAASISLSLAALAWFAHAAKDRFVGTTTEGGLAFLVLLMWIGGLPVIMKPENNIANTVVRAGGSLSFGVAILNANLYFFSWAAFIMSFSLMNKYMTDVHGYGRPEGNMWTALMATSFVVMASSSRIWKSGFDDFCDLTDDDPDICVRTKFAIGIGTVSTVLCALWAMLGHKLGDMIEALMSLMMLTFWCFGVGYITFGSGPGRNIGNLFFGTWGSFGLAVMLASNSVHTMMGKFTKDDDAKGDDKAGDMKDEEKDNMPDVEETHEEAGEA